MLCRGKGSSHQNFLSEDVGLAAVAAAGIDLGVAKQGAQEGSLAQVDAEGGVARRGWQALPSIAARRAGPPVRVRACARQGRPAHGRGWSLCSSALASICWATLLALLAQC